MVHMPPPASKSQVATNMDWPTRVRPKPRESQSKSADGGAGAVLLSAATWLLIRFLCWGGSEVFMVVEEKDLLVGSECRLLCVFWRRKECR